MSASHLLNQLSESDILALQEKILNRRQVSGPHGCWLWSGCRRKGYGASRIPRGPVIDVHIISFFLFGGKLSDGKEVSHLCHEKLCFNPDHLTLESRMLNSSRNLCYTGQTCWHHPRCII